MTFAVATHDLTKRYADRTVVDNLELRIPQGCVYGFLGPNGAGKSTTMKMLLSLIHPSSGQVQIFDRPMNRSTRRELLGGIGSLIESPPGYGHLTGAENLRLVQRLLDLHDRQIDFAVRTARLHDHLDKVVRDYSLGMKQRLGIAMALARQPQLLILDEPTNGLDPAGIEEIRDLLRHLADDGVTVMISSHQLGEIDKTATVLGILAGGRLIFQGSRDHLLRASAPDVLFDCVQPRNAYAILRERVSDRVADPNADGSVRVAGLDDADIAASVATLVGTGVGVIGVRREEQRLEDIFMDLTRGGGL